MGTWASGRKAGAVALEKVMVSRGRCTNTSSLSRKEGMTDQRDKCGTEGASGWERRLLRVPRSPPGEKTEGMVCAPCLEKLEGEGGAGGWSRECGSDGNVSQSPEDPQTLLGM